MNDERQSIRWRIVLFAMIVYAVLSVWMAVASKGFLEADGITHYNARRWALQQPVHIVSIWNRPLCVLLYCLPTHYFGLIGTRVTSLVLVLLMALITLSVARRLKLGHPELCAIALLTQPLLFAHSFSELTEVPFALLLICMFWAYVARVWWLLAILASIGPWARPEGFVILAFTAVTLVVQRRSRWLFILPIGLLLWSYCGWMSYGGPKEYPWWKWLPRNWPYSSTSMYDAKRITRFVELLPAVIGPLAFPFVWIGAYRFVECTDHTDLPVNRNRLLVAIGAMGVLIGHSILTWRGAMASNGEPRYMLIASPFWAILACAGYTWFAERFEIKNIHRWAILAAVVPIACNLYYPVLPLKAQDDDRLADEVRAWISTQSQLRISYPRLALSLPHLLMQLDLDPLDHSAVVDSSRTSVASHSSGVILVWDEIYSTHNSNSEYCVDQKLLDENGWVPIKDFNREHRKVIVYLSPKDAAGHSSDGRRIVPGDTAQ